MNPHCQCKEPGYCQRHKMQKVGRLYEFCQGTANTADCGFKYWRAWEMGQMGATAPDEPKLEPWECSNTVMPRRIKPVSKSRNVMERKPPTKRRPRPLGLGDRVEQALSLVGITEERVSKWLGRPCSCSKRKQKLNQLGAWASRVLLGKTDQAEKYLDEIVNDQ